LIFKKKSARDDIPNAEQIQKLLQDLRETRQVKARTGLKYLDDKWLGVSIIMIIMIIMIEKAKRKFNNNAFIYFR
jgi:GINS complex subunit 2